MDLMVQAPKMKTREVGICRDREEEQITIFKTMTQDSDPLH